MVDCDESRVVHKSCFHGPTVTGLTTGCSGARYVPMTFSEQIAVGANSGNL